jgi:hypothetical protein
VSLKTKGGLSKNKMSSITPQLRFTDYLRPANMCKEKCKQLQGKEKENCVSKCWEVQKAHNTRLLFGD